MTLVKTFERLRYIVPGLHKGKPQRISTSVYNLVTWLLVRDFETFLSLKKHNTNCLSSDIIVDFYDDIENMKICERNTTYSLSKYWAHVLHLRTNLENVNNSTSSRSFISCHVVYCDFQ